MTNISQNPNPPEVQALFSAYKANSTRYHLAALRECLISLAYEDLVRSAQKALRAKGLKDPEQASDLVHHMLYDELERLLETYDENRSLIDFLHGCIYRDYTFGRPYWLRKQGKYDLSLELELLEQADLVESTIADPETEFFAEDMTELDLSEHNLDDVLPQAIETWVKEDEHNPEAQLARQIVYTGAMHKVLEILKAGQEPFTPTGRLRLGKETFRDLENRAGRSDRTVRSHLRAPEPRIDGLKRGS